jgi:hypothetical protein
MEEGVRTRQKCCPLASAQTSYLYVAPSTVRSCSEATVRNLLCDILKEAIVADAKEIFVMPTGGTVRALGEGCDRPLI